MQSGNRVVGHVNRKRPTWKNDERTSTLSDLAVAITLPILGQNGALAQDYGTPEQQEACKPDVFRLCSSYIPDAERIAACLRVNEQSLSPACHDVSFPPRVIEEPKPKKPKRRVKP
jgi:hypothetical protein